MFIKPDEYIIVMEDLFTPFSIDDLHKLEDAGIKTIYLTHPIRWEKINRNGIFDWSSLDEIIEKYLTTGLKLLVPFYYTMPTWFPNEYYITRHPTLLDHNIPNYSNPDFVGEVDRFLLSVLSHLDSIKERVQVTYAIPAGGEFLWDSCRVEPFPVHPNAIIDFVVGRQKIFHKQHGEIWTLFHNFLGDPMNWNNTQLPALYDALSKEFIGSPRYSIQGAHFSCGDYFTDKEKQMKVRTYKKQYGVQSFVGSNYCEGLLSNFDAAIEQEVRGFLTAPLHLENPKHPKFIEDWMLDSIKECNKRFKDHYGSN